MWEIISFGNTITLNKVFNAIAAIFQDGGYIAAGSAIALFVVVATSLSSLVDGKSELPFARLFAGILVYSVTFGQLTNVSIENRYDGTVTQVDNIPIAIAVPASLISQVGLYLAETTQTAFGMTDPINQVTQNGYLSPLSVLAKIYGETHNKQCPSGAQASRGMGIDLCKSLPEYVEACAQVRIQQEGIGMEMREVDLLKALESNSVAFTANMVTDSGSIVTMPCADAYNLIKNASIGTVGNNMLSTFNETSGARIGETAETRTEDAMSAIQADSGKARNFLLTQFFMRGIENGTISYLNSNGMSDVAENLNSSIEQRNYNWQLQGEMWVQIVDKFIAMLEGIIYSMTPFIGLMLLTGSIGSKTVLLFFQILAVFQIIPSMLVISQSIIMDEVIRYQAQLASKYDVGSLLYVHSLMLEVKEQMGLGGMISATVIPAIAMALVTGSGMAVMGAMKGAAAQAKDTDAMPDVASQGGAINDLSERNMGVRDQFGNVMTKSAKTEVPQIAQSAALTQTVTQAEQQAKTAEKGYNTTTSNAIQTLQSQGFSTNDLIQLNDQATAGHSSFKDWQTQTSKSLDEQFKLGTESAERVSALASFGLTFGKVGANLVNEVSDTLNKQEQEALKHVMTNSGGEGLRASFDEAKSAATSNGEVITTGNQVVDTQMQQYSKAEAEKEQAQQTYNEAKQAQAGISVEDGDIAGFMHKHGNDKEVQERLHDRWKEMSNEEQAYFADKFDEYNGGVNANNMDDNTARLMALAATDNYFDNEVKFAETVTGININDDLEELSEAKNNVNTSVEHGKLEREDITKPDRDSVPTAHSLDFESEKDRVIEQNELNRLNVEAAKLKNNETGGQINEGEVKLKDDANKVGGTEGTQEKVSDYVEKSLDIIEQTFIPSESEATTEVKEYAKGEGGESSTSSYSYVTQQPDNTINQPSGVNTTELYDLPVEDEYNKNPSIGSQPEPVVSNEKQDATITPSTQDDNGEESSHIQNRLNELSEHVVGGLSEKLDELKDDLFDGIQNHNK
ncbi:conjugal transfer protein TraG N-terminal domain-containing protein [Vibrio splendidus]